jgi:hypothetical protein
MCLCRGRLGKWKPNLYDPQKESINIEYMYIRFPYDKDSNGEFWFENSLASVSFFVSGLSKFYNCRFFSV